MCNDQLNLAWKTKLPSSVKLVVVCLADHADSDGVCWPGINTIAARTGLNRRTVIRHINLLDNMGLIVKQRRPGKGGGAKSNHYTLHLKQGDHKPLLQSDSEGGQGDFQCRQSDSEGGQGDPVPPEPSLEPSLEPSCSTDFEQWWAEYPKKVSKKTALKAWQKAKRPRLEAMLTTLRNQKIYEQQWQGGTKFIPNPSRYLNEEKWNDDIQHGRSNEPLSPAEEYEQRVKRENEIISNLNGSFVDANGKVIPPPVDESEWRNGQQCLSRLDD